jgi:hypothetical protein
MLLDSAQPAGPVQQSGARRGSARAPVRNYIPHNSTDRGLDAIAEMGSISVIELQILLERAAGRQRKE